MLNVSKNDKLAIHGGAKNVIILRNDVASDLPVKRKRGAKPQDKKSYVQMDLNACFSTDRIVKRAGRQSVS